MNRLRKTIGNTKEYLKDTDRMKRKIKKFLHIDKRMVPAKIASFLNGIQVGCYGGFLNVFFVSVGLTKFHAGVISGVMYAPPVLSQPFWGYIADKKERKGLVLAILCIGTSLFFFPLPWIAYIIYPVSTYHCNTTLGSNISSISNNTNFIDEANNRCPGVFDEERELVLFGVFLAMTSVGSVFLVPIESYVPALVMDVVKSMPGHVSFGKQATFETIGVALANIFAGEAMKQYKSYTSPYTPVFFIFLASIIILIPVGFHMMNQAKNAKEKIADKNTNNEGEDTGLEGEPNGNVPRAMIEQENMNQNETRTDEFGSTDDPGNASRRRRSSEEFYDPDKDRMEIKHGSTKEDFVISVTNGVIKRESSTKSFSSDTEDGARRESINQEIDTSWVIRRASSEENVNNLDTRESNNKRFSISTPDEGNSGGYTNELFNITGQDNVDRKGPINHRLDTNTKSIRKKSTIRRMSIVVSCTVDAIKNLSKKESVKKRRRSIWSKRIDLQHLQAQYELQDMRKELIRFLKSFGIIFYLLSVFVAGFGNAIICNFAYMLFSERKDKWDKIGVDMTWSFAVANIASTIFYPLADKSIELVKGPIPALIIGIFFCFVRMLVMSYDLHVYVMIAVQALDAFSYILAMTSILEHTHQITPRHLIMTMDGIVLAVNRSVSGLLSGIIGGEIFMVYGGSIFYQGGSFLCLGWSFIMIGYYGCKKWISYLDLDFDEEEIVTTKTSENKVSLNEGVVNMRYVE